MMSLADKLKGIDLSQLQGGTCSPAISTGQRTGPLWRGPDQDGITFSLLSRYLVCRERFRVLVMDGLKAKEGFNHRMEFGNLWHVCEEALAKGDDPTRGGRVDRKVPLWEEELLKYATRLARRYPLQQEQVEHWYDVCRVTFPQYVDHWKKHPDVRARTPLLSEEPFKVPYKLPSGRTVLLRGKWDSVDLVDEVCGACDGRKGAANPHTHRFHSCATCNGKGTKQRIWLQENKTKGDINEAQLKRQLASGFDLQTMLYLTALWELPKHPFNQASRSNWVFDGEADRPDYNGAALAGIRYNVIRRPLSGGKGTIVRHKATQGAKCPKCKGEGKIPALRQAFPAGSICEKCRGKGRVGGKPEETKESFYKRVKEYIKAEPESYFMRWNVDLSPGDLDRFKRQTLDPILENLCDDYEWWFWCQNQKEDVYDEQTRYALFVSANVGAVKGSPHRQRHFRFPYGVRNPLTEGSQSEVDDYLNTGSTTGLERIGTLYPELEESGG